MGNTCGQCVYFIPDTENDPDAEWDEGYCVLDGEPGVLGIFEDDTACSDFSGGEEE